MPTEGTLISYNERKARATSYAAYPADDELVQYIQKYLGCSRSEAIRTSIRSFAAHLAYLQGSRVK